MILEQLNTALEVLAEMKSRLIYLNHVVYTEDIADEIEKALDNIHYQIENLNQEHGGIVYDGKY